MEALAYIQSAFSETLDLWCSTKVLTRIVPKRVNEIIETRKLIVLIKNRGRQFEKVVLPSFNRYW